MHANWTTRFTNQYTCAVEDSSKSPLSVAICTFMCCKFSISCPAIWGTWLWCEWHAVIKQVYKKEYGRVHTLLQIEMILEEPALNFAQVLVEEIKGMCLGWCLSYTTPVLHNFSVIKCIIGMDLIRRVVSYQRMASASKIMYVKVYACVWPVVQVYNCFQPPGICLSYTGTMAQMKQLAKLMAQSGTIVWLELFSYTTITVRIVICKLLYCKANIKRKIVKFHGVKGTADVSDCGRSECQWWCQ